MLAFRDFSRYFGTGNRFVVWLDTFTPMMHFEGPFLTGTNPELDAQCRAIYWGTRLWLYSFAVLHKPRWLERKPPSRVLDLGCADGRLGELLPFECVAFGPAGWWKFT